MKRFTAFILAVLMLAALGCSSSGSGRRTEREGDMFDQLAEADDSSSKAGKKEEGEGDAPREASTAEPRKDAAMEEPAPATPAPPTPGPSDEPTAEPTQEPTPEPTPEPDPDEPVLRNGLLTVPDIVPQETYAPDAEILTWTGSFDSEKEIDRYTFTAPRDGSYSFFYTDILDGQRYCIQVANAAGNVIYNPYWYDSSGLDDCVVLELKQGQTYTLAARQQGSYYGGYAIHVGIPKESIEIGAYTAIHDSFAYMMQRNSYTLVPSVSGEYCFSVSGMPEGFNCRIQVRNAAGNSISNGYWYSQYGNNEGQTVTLNAGQAYTICIRESGYRGTYCFDVAMYKQVGDISAAFAVDDSIQFLNQRNLYTFVPTRTASYAFGISGIPEGYAYRIRILNPAGNAISNYYWYDACSNEESVSVNLTAGQKYTVIVRPAGMLYGAYRLDVGTYRAPIAVTEDDSFTDVISFRLQRNLYTFTAASDGRYSIQLSGMPEGYSYYVRIENAAGQSVGRGYSDGTYSNGESLSADLVGGQTYTVIVWQYASYLSEYSLRIFKA